MLQNHHLSPRMFMALSALAALIGLSASAIGAWFFTLGLQQTEQDEIARHALIFAGVLLTLCQLLAFGTAALLPQPLLQKLRWGLVALGVVLFGFEVVTMSVTQLALVKSSDVQVSAAEARIEELHAAIASHRATAAGLRDNAAAQSRSLLAASRERGAQALKEALEVESRIAPLAAELAQLQSTRKQTLTTVLGDSRTVVFAVVRSALIALVGMSMMSVAGVLFRFARAVDASRARPAEVSHVSVVEPSPTPAPVALPQLQPQAQPQLEPQPAPEPAAAPVVAPVQAAGTAEVAGTAVAARNDAAEEAAYQRVREAVLQGRFKPSARDIQRVGKTSQAQAQHFLARLERDAVTRRRSNGRGYELAT